MREGRNGNGEKNGKEERGKREKRDNAATEPHLMGNGAERVLRVAFGGALVSEQKREEETEKHHKTD
jgi:hypothetical protein